MRKTINVSMIICICLLMIVGCGKKEEDVQTQSIEVNHEEVKEMVQNTISEIPEVETEKVALGIKNWSRATLALDSSYPYENQKLLNEKFYEVIKSEEEREKVVEERKQFFSNSVIKTTDIIVSVSEIKDIEYNSRSVGQVTCMVTVKGTRNQEDFERVYDLVLIMEYQQNIASVYEIEKIVLK